MSTRLGIGLIEVRRLALYRAYRYCTHGHASLKNFLVHPSTRPLHLGDRALDFTHDNLTSTRPDNPIYFYLPAACRRSLDASWTNLGSRVSASHTRHEAMPPDAAETLSGLLVNTDQDRYYRVPSVPGT
jgi:hypothetical protein